MSNVYLDILKQMVGLAGHLAWPVTTIILLLLTRRQITQVAAAIVKRIEDPKSPFKIGPSGVEVGASIHQVGSDLSDDTQKLNARHKSDATFSEKLADWLEKESPGLPPTSLLDGTEYEELRKKAVQYFQL